VIAAGVFSLGADTGIASRCEIPPPVERCELEKRYEHRNPASMTEQVVRQFKRRVRREFPDEPTDAVFERFDDGDGLDRKALRKLLEWIGLSLDAEQLKQLRKQITKEKVISFEVCLACLSIPAPRNAVWLTLVFCCRNLERS
jgi:hypothetical protein